MKTNINLLDLDNDILNIIGDYVIEDNIKNDCLKQWIEIYTKKKIIKDLDKQIELLMAEQSDLNIQIKRQKELKEGKKSVGNGKKNFTLGDKPNTTKKTPSQTA
jgi:hypothetical protein